MQSRYARLWIGFTATLTLCCPWQPAPSFATNPSADLQAAYQSAWQLVKDNYFPGVDETAWQKWQHAFDGQLHNRKQLSAAIASMVRSLNDDYSYLMNARNESEHRKLVSEKHSVSARMLPNAIGYVKISTFEADNVVPEFRSAMQSLSHAQAFILDLRSNHGGYIAHAQQVFAMLTDAGKFMSYEGRQHGQPDHKDISLETDAWQVMQNNDSKVTQRLPNFAADKPLVVLVNEDTRSAAELLAGALRENGRAFLVGTTTYGKGVLQDTYTVAPGIEIKLVTARYYLPDGDCPQCKGLTPDLEVGNSKTKADRQLKAAQQLGAFAVAQRQQKKHTTAWR